MKTVSNNIMTLPTFLWLWRLAKSVFLISYALNALLCNTLMVKRYDFFATSLHFLSFVLCNSRFPQKKKKKNI